MSGDQHTLPLPDPGMRWVLAADQVSAPKRRKRWPIVLGIALGVVGVLIGLESIARAVTPQIVRDALVDNLGLPQDQQIDVTIPGLLLPQLAIGSVASAEISAPDVEREGLSGDIHVELADIPIWGGVDWSSGFATITMTESQVGALLARIDGFPVDALTVADGKAGLSTELDLFGAKVPVGAEMSLSAREGDVVLTPATITLAGTTISAEALLNQVGPLISSFVKEWTVCIAEYVPSALSLADASIDEDRVTLRFEIDSSILGDATAQAVGTCE